MKKQTISSSELRLLMFLLALILIAGSYFLVFQNLVGKAQTYETQNEQDAQTLQQLELMAARQEIVKQQTEDYRLAIEAVVARYPSAIPQDKVITIIQDMEDQTGIEVDAVGFMMDAMIGNIYTPAAETETAAADSTDPAADPATDPTADPTAEQTAETPAAPAENTAVDVTTPCGYYHSITISYRTDYAGFKKLPLYAMNAADRMTISDINVAFDSESGQLSGTMTLNMYYLTNTGREYIEPSITGTASAGVSDIFRTAGGKKKKSDE